ncbi:hypothetical protein R84B8_03197 [Treponema sp. R8-4-B8]
MKKIFIVLLAAVSFVSVFAQEFNVGGEVKGGILWEKIENRQPDVDNIERVRLNSKDDAGDSYGRFRINADYTNAAGNLGIKARLNWDNYTSSNGGPTWSYAFGWGNFFNNQLTLSLGKLGGSPWGSGGPEMWRELEVSSFGGMRIEYKPSFVPGKLNIGFVLNWYDDVADAGGTKEPTILDLLQESVVGMSYANDYFMLRFAYRFDSDLDKGGARSGSDGQEGTKFVYRVEEYMLKRALDGLSIWALGEFTGIGASDPSFFFTRNWLFVQYAPTDFTAQIRFGFEKSENRAVAYAKPYFAYNFLGKLIVPSIMFCYAQDFGEGKRYPDSPFAYLEFEPKVQVNFSPGAYVAFSYYYRMEYKYARTPPEEQTQWMNLRFGITY